MEQYQVTGMTCAACQARVEKAVGKVAGVTSCSVSLLTNSMAVNGTAPASDIIQAVEHAGYHATLKGQPASNTAYGTSEEDSLADRETPLLKKRLLSSVIFLVLLMYISMGHTMFNLPLIPGLAGNPMACGLAQLLLATIVMIINQRFFIGGFKAILNSSPNMDTLVAMGSGAAYAYSVYSLFAMSTALINADYTKAVAYSHELYFESAAMILSLITVGKMLEARSKGKTTSALKGLMQLKPKTAVIISDDRELTIPISQLKKDDIFVVKPGESFPTDGIIIKGHCAIDESALTGESIPVDKTEGDPVYGATINKSGYIHCQATHVGEDTTLSQIIRMVSDAAATKAPIAKVADRVSGVFVPVVITIALITAVVWLLAGETFGFALARAISVLVISCPCALGLATPVAIMVGNGVGAKNNILFKNASALEAAGHTRIVALDKTGTITNGTPVVTDVIPADGINEQLLLSTAYSLEVKSEHPLAAAIVSYAEKRSVSPMESDLFMALPGNGLQAVIDNAACYGGNRTYIEQYTHIDTDTLTAAEGLAKQGKTPLFFAKDHTLLGIIAVADTVRQDSPAAISELQHMGITVVMLTGDNIVTANAIKEITGVDEVVAGVLPAGKEAVIQSLRKYGHVTMVGDGINDAPALTAADIGIAIGAGTDVAIDAADIVLMKNSLMDIPAAIRLSRATLTNIHENLFWAFIYNIIGIPLAAGVWIPLFGLKLNPMFGALAMSLSSFCVVSNALRLNTKNIRSTKHDRSFGKAKTAINLTNINGTVSSDNNSNDNNNKNNNNKENETMERTLTIEGMMCGHCEARVKKVLEALDGVTEVTASHTAGTAVVKMDKEVPYELLKETVEAQDYKVID